MIFSLLADLVLVAHGTFVLFVVLGGLLVLRSQRASWVHVPCALWGAWVEFAGWICPLTPLEVDLRRRAGGAGYTGGFIERYVTSALYPQGLTREIRRPPAQAPELNGDFLAVAAPISGGGLGARPLPNLPVAAGRLPWNVGDCPMRGTEVGSLALRDVGSQQLTTPTLHEPQRLLGLDDVTEKRGPFFESPRYRVVDEPPRLLAKCDTRIGTRAGFRCIRRT